MAKTTQNSWHSRGLFFTPLRKELMYSLILFVVMALSLSACGIIAPTETSLLAQSTPDLTQLVTIELTIQADTSVPFNTVGQVINFTYTIKNTGLTAVSADLPTDITITGATATCPAITAVGNLDTLFDPNETIVCTSSYSITQADLDKGSVTNIATANVHGIISNQATTTVATVPALGLKLTKTASPETYDRVGLVITYSYVITNSGTSTLGPTQFTVSDTGISTPINCGNADTTLASNATVNCSATYTVTQADMDAGSVSTSATASGGGAGPSQPAAATIKKSAVAQPVPGSFTAGTTVQHTVVDGEWLWQIARCYGADPTKVVQANTQLPNPAVIEVGTIVTVPNIGSVGKIYAPLPCVGTHTVQAGDTWNSIAQKYNADPLVLQMVNANTLTVGAVIKVPLNSASAGGVIPTTGSTDTCVDLTRSLRLAGLNASTTHFNVCGTLDASGNMKIKTIKVSQRPEDVPTGALSQDITLPSSIETATPVNDPNSLIVGDMNYDGNDDFRIVRLLPGGPNIPYVYYLFDPATRQFVYNGEYGKIKSPEFPGNSQIVSQWRKGADNWGIDTYTITNNIPRLIQREEWVAINATQATHTVTVFNADGTSQVTVNETVPIP